MARIELASESGRDSESTVHS